MSRWFWQAMIIITVVVNWAAVCSAANADDPAIFKWTNEQGTIIFTDDPTAMPRSDKQPKKREPVKGESRQVQLDQDISPIKNETKQEREMSGGHGEGRRRQKTNLDTATGARTAHQNRLNNNYYIQVSISQCKLTIFRKEDPGADGPGKDIQGRDRRQRVGSISCREGKDNPDRPQPLLVSNGTYQKNI